MGGGGAGFPFAAAAKALAELLALPSPADPGGESVAAGLYGGGGASIAAVAEDGDVKAEGLEDSPACLMASLLPYFDPRSGRPPVVL